MSFIKQSREQGYPLYSRVDNKGVLYITMKKKGVLIYTTVENTGHPLYSTVENRKILI